MGAAFEAVLAVTKKVTVLIFALFCPRTFEVAAKRACFDCLGQARGAETMSGAAERLGIHPQRSSLAAPGVPPGADS